jgi:hypothetical protein
MCTLSEIDLNSHTLEHTSPDTLRPFLHCYLLIRTNTHPTPNTHSPHCDPFLFHRYLPVHPP